MGFDAGATCGDPPLQRDGTAERALPRPRRRRARAQDVAIQFIGDGVHVADEMMRLAFAAAAGSLPRRQRRHRCRRVRLVHRPARRRHRSRSRRRRAARRRHDRGQHRQAARQPAAPRAPRRWAEQRPRGGGVAPRAALDVADSVSLVPGSVANFFVLNDEFELARRVTPDEIIDL